MDTVITKQTSFHPSPTDQRLVKPLRSCSFSNQQPLFKDQFPTCTTSRVKQTKPPRESGYRNDVNSAVNGGKWGFSPAVEEERQNQMVQVLLLNDHRPTSPSELTNL